MTIGEVRFAAFGWSPFDDAWRLWLLDAEGDASTLSVRWENCLHTPGLETRYEALADLGYTVVSGGEGAWHWQYLTSEDTGETYRTAFARVRPLAAADVAALPTFPLT